MGAPSIIRAQSVGDKTTVRVLMAHEMESGLRRDNAGKLVPAWFIQQVVATLNGRPVFNAQFGPSMAKNPYMQFVVRSAKPGDKLALRWTDSRGDQRSDEATVT